MKNKIGLVFIFICSLAFAQTQTTEESVQKKLVDYALKYEGVPYVYGAESPKAFDCSGFVRYVFRNALGLDLPRNSKSYISVGSTINWKDAKIGDIFVYDTVGGRPSHVAIYIGQDKIIHAASSGPRTGVIISPVTDKYWSARIISARSMQAEIAAISASQNVAAASPPQPSPEAVAKPLAPKADAKPAPASPPKPDIAAKPDVKPVTTKPQPSADTAIAEIGIIIPAAKSTETDKIPMASGTEAIFTLTNGSKKDGAFIVTFFYIDAKTYSLKSIHNERLVLATNQAKSLPAYKFDKPGKYSLVVKDNWANQLFIREFIVK